MSDQVIVEDQKITVHTASLRTVVDCAVPRVVAGEIRILHDQILDARTAGAREVADGEQLKRDLADERNRTIRKEDRLRQLI